VAKNARKRQMPKSKSAPAPASITVEEEAAKRLKVGRNQAYQAAHNDELPVICKRLPGRSAQREKLSAKPQQHRTIDNAFITRQDLPTSKIEAGFERLLTGREAADRLRVSVSWLAKARIRGDGPPFMKFGRSIRYAEGALSQWTEAHLRDSTNER